MKKILIIFLLAGLLFFNFKSSLSQIGIPVPVTDSSVVNTLAQLINQVSVTNFILTDEFMKLNNNIINFLQTSVDKKLNDIFLDFGQSMSSLEAYVEMKKTLESRKVTEEDIKEAKEEAAIAAALSTAKQIPSLTNCLTPGARSLLLSYFENRFTSDFDYQEVKESYLESINSIPDCEFGTDENETTVYKPSRRFLANIFKPIDQLFNPRHMLAQTGSLSGETTLSEESEIVIYDARQETEDHLLFTQLRNNILSLEMSSINNNVARRIQQLGTYKPVEECIKPTFSNTGKFICQEYKTEVDFNTLANNFFNLKPPSSEYNLYLNFINSNLAPFLGVGEPEISSTTLAENSVKTLSAAQNFCDKLLPLATSTAASTAGRYINALSFANCLKQTAERNEQFLESQEQRAEELNKGTDEVIKKIAALTSTIDKLLSNITTKEKIQNCPGIEKELTKLKNILEEKKKKYENSKSAIIGIKSTINLDKERIKREILKDLDDVIVQLEKITGEQIDIVDKALDNLLRKAQEWLQNQINNLLNKWGVAGIFEDIFGFKEGKNIKKVEDISKNLTNMLIQELEDKQVVIKLGEFGNITLDIAATVVSSTDAFMKLNELGINRPMINTHLIELDKISKKVKTYERLLEGEGGPEALDKICKGNRTETPSSVSMMRPKVIVERKQPKKPRFSLRKIFSWFSLDIRPKIIAESKQIKKPLFDLSKIFSWRSVEINFKR